MTASSSASDQITSKEQITLIEAKVIQTPNFLLEITAKNTSRTTLYFDKWAIETRNSLPLGIVPIGQFYNGLEEYVGIDDPPILPTRTMPFMEDYRTIELKADERFVSTYNLEAAFPSLRENLRQKELILFWHKRIQPLDSSSKTVNLGGVIRLPKID